MDSTDPVRISAAALYKAAPLLIPAYGAVLSLIYLQCYWGFFDVNVFSYLSAADVALAAMYGLLPLLLMIVVGVWSGLASARSTQPSSARMTVRDYLDVVLFLGLLALSAYYWRPSIGLGLSAFLLALILKPLVRRIREMTTSRVAALVMFVALATPLLVAGGATTSALNVSLSPSRALAAVSGTVLDAAAGADVRHLGHVGEFDFFYIAETKAVLRVQSSSIDQIRFIRRRSSAGEGRDIS